MPTVPTLSKPMPASFWHKPLASNLPLNPNSAAMISALTAQKKMFNIQQWATSIYSVGASQPRVPIIVDNAAPMGQLLQTAMNAEGGVPIPQNAQPSGYLGGPQSDTDSHLSILMPTWKDGTNRGVGKLWEFWRVSSPVMNKPGAGQLPWGAPSFGDSQWHVTWGGSVSFLDSSPGYPVKRVLDDTNWASRQASAKQDMAFEETNFLGTATSLALAQGMVRFVDWNQGKINHVMGLSLPQAILSPGHVWPAQRDDGKGTGPFQEGMRLRLPPNYVVDTTLPAMIQLMIIAARDYGFVVWDASGSVAVRFERQKSGDPVLANVWQQSGMPFEWNSPYQMANLFPWQDLVVLA